MVYKSRKNRFRTQNFTPFFGVRKYAQVDGQSYDFLELFSQELTGFCLDLVPIDIFDHCLHVILASFWHMEIIF